MARVSTVEGLLADLFGDAVDVSGLVAKMSPGPSDVHVMGPMSGGKLKPYKRQKGVAYVDKRDSLKRRVENGVGFGATAIGTGLGVHELAGQIPKAYPGTRAARGAERFTAAAEKTPLARLSPRARVGIAGGMLAGDVVATSLLRPKRKPQPQPVDQVDKGLVPEKLVAGFVSRARRMTGYARGTVGDASSARTGAQMADNKGAKAAGAIGQGVRTGAAQAVSGTKQLAQTGGGQAALAGTAVAGATAGYHHSATRRADDPYVYAPNYGTASKSDVEFAGTFSKFDDDKQRAYGWASVVTLDGLPVIDRQGDFIGLDDIEEAAYTYVRKSRVTGRMHERTHDDQPVRAGELIESVVFTPEKCEAMGVSKNLAGKWWMGVQVEDEEAWSKVKKGEWTGFSIHGRGIRRDVSHDDVMNGRA